MKKYYAPALIAVSLFSAQAMADICDTYFDNMDAHIELIDRTRGVEAQYKNTISQLYAASKAQINNMPKGQNRTNTCTRNNARVKDQMAAWQMTYQGDISSRSTSTSKKGSKAQKINDSINQTTETVNQLGKMFGL
ncbi:DUF5339 family protein [Entomomonas sp. E2T0]|uniref:DUF5339 family protein n=1 Tax=Entomomonas sp. E2T0 TaxID=2930213 RepID=UPI0022281BEE|nr:DUF5339 family protein [Entomomonas sp. E2T0]UYZ82763.1 DUF5339 family protein [Entomomonas sp. E2T0]